MFAKKPAGPKAPWAVRLLTADFLVDGYSDTEAHPESWPFFTPQTGASPAGLLWLDRPRFTPVTTAPKALVLWLDRLQAMGTCIVRGAMRRSSSAKT